MFDLRRAALAALLGTLALAGCRSGPKHPPQWQRSSVHSGSERILWQVTALALAKEGFPTGSGLDPTTLTAISGWRNDLSPFRGKGYREQAQVRFTPAGAGRWDVEVRVRRELNMDIVKPLDLKFAEWEEAPDDPDRAGVLLQRIRSWMVDEAPQFGDPPELPGQPKPARPKLPGT
jgi:hypothetical protein